MRSMVEGAQLHQDYPEPPEAPSTGLRPVPLPRFAALHGGAQRWSILPRYAGEEGTL